MPFRFFLLSLCLVTAVAQAQEPPAPAAPPAAAPTPAAAEDAVPTVAAPVSGEKAAAEVVPFDASTLLSVGVPRSKAERDEMAERATLLKEESRLRKEEAEKNLAEASPVCWKKFLVSACLDDARVAYRKDVSIAKRQERQSQSLERNVRKFDAAEHARQRDEDNARKDAENARKAAEHRAKQEAKNQAREGKSSRP